MFRNRYGADKLSWAMIGCSILLTLIAALIDANNMLMRIILLVMSAALLVYAGIRIFSKDIRNRQRELRAMELAISRVRCAFVRDTEENKSTDDNENDNEATFDEKPEPEEKHQDAKANDGGTTSEYRYFKCPKCKKPLKVPAGKGYVHVMCPTCSYKFKKHT